MQHNDRDFKGVWIPKDIYINRDLSSSDKLLLAEIIRNDNGDGCTLSNKQISENIGLSEGQTANCISKLRKNGFINDKSFDGRVRTIQFTLPR